MAMKRKWDSDFGFLLYALGWTCAEIARKFKISGDAVEHACEQDDWDGKRVLYLAERAKVIGANCSKEQQFFRAEECRMARQLLGLGVEMLATMKVEGASPADVCRVLDLASRLGRLGSGLPLNQVEVSQTYDLGENLMQAIERAYSSEPKPIDVVSPEPEMS
jgi:hypothetical protein